MPPATVLADRYVMFEEIASGGMAAVHFGRLKGPAGFSKNVAIKQLHPHLARDPEFSGMLLDEARLAARIQHPNVVATLEVLTPATDLYIVMEYVDGESLSRLVRSARDQSLPIPSAIVVAIMVGVLNGLHAAHEAMTDQGEPLNVVHRDVSPQNILVGADGVARVLDFGIAKAAGRLHSTQDGRVKGKAAYMSPEQVRGEEVDRRTDIFAASVVLWEALTLQRLFMADSPGESMARILATKVKPPSTIVPSLSARLDEIVLKGLSSRAADRFATASAMAHALEDAVSPATTRVVAEWVSSLAGDTLIERRARYSGFTATQVDNTSRPTVPDPMLAPEQERSDASQIGSFATPSSDPAERRRAIPIALVLGAGLLAGGFFWNSRRHEPVAARLDSVQPATSLQASTSSPSASTSIATAVTSSAATAGSATATPSSTPTATPSSNAANSAGSAHVHSHVSHAPPATSHAQNCREVMRPNDQGIIVPVWTCE